MRFRGEVFFGWLFGISPGSEKKKSKSWKFFGGWKADCACYKGVWVSNSPTESGVLLAKKAGGASDNEITFNFLENSWDNLCIYFS
jgi:hypothetical protein